MFQIVRMNNQYSVWKGNYDFISDENRTIESWMSVNLIHNQFDVRYDLIFNVMNLTDNDSNRRIVLKKYCLDFDVNCDLMIDRIENSEIIK